MSKLSVALATYNEQSNLKDCLSSVKDIADEIVIVDGSSTDQTVVIAKEFQAKVIVTDNPPIFHINKQKALEMTKNDWILQMDADERITPELASEIKKIIFMTDEEIAEYQKNLPGKKLFLRHQKLIEKRDVQNWPEKGEYVAFFIPRLNYFLGRYLKYGGVYPDGVIRLIKKGKAHFPCIDVHEQIAVEGRVGWLAHPLLYKDSPTFSRYLKRNKRYIDLLAAEYQHKRIKKNPVSLAKYMVIMPIWWFFLTFVRHKGFKDSWQGFMFSFFSALRFPRAYLKYNGK